MTRSGTPRYSRRTGSGCCAGTPRAASSSRVLAQAQSQHLLSTEHFTVDGRLIEAWAGLKSFKRKGAPQTPPDDPGNPTVNLHGERRSNATHDSTTDPPVLRAPNGVLKDIVDYWGAGKATWEPEKIRVPTLLILAEWDQETPLTWR